MPERPSATYRTQDLYKWIRERHTIYLRRKNLQPKPWTQDLILQRYRFCNVYRELDTVTQWINKHWRTPFAKDPNLWFLMCVARLVNWPDTLQDLGNTAVFCDGCVCWYPEFFKATMRFAIKNGKAWGGAYIVSTNGNAIAKEEYIADRVLTPLWDARKAIAVEIHDSRIPATLRDVHHALCGYIGLGSFMAAQVVADLKYVRPLSNATDWWTWAASGPGSRRGLNRVMGLPTSAPMPEANWLAHVQVLRIQVNNLLRKHKGFSELHAQDLQNCLCEFDKYERTRLGEGRPRATYQGV